jgi:DUF2971 family protein
MQQQRAPWLPQETPPPILYHYTGVIGLHGIVTSNSFWATHAAFMNDGQELSYGLKLAESILAQREQSVAGSAKNDIEWIRDVCRLLPESGFYLFSLSEAGDLLSQWRAYGADGAGAAIGLSSNALRGLGKSKGIDLIPCVYSPEDQQRMLNALIDRIIEATELQNKIMMQASFIWNLADVVSCIKHPSFAEEREWRMVISIVPPDHEAVGYRPSGELLLPFYRLQLVDADTAIPLQKIIIGPASQSQLAARALHDFLWKEGLRDIDIEASNISYRPRR